jgi:hypothetical protein
MDIMNKKTTFLSIFALSLIFQGLFLVSIPYAKTNQEIPEKYSQQVELDRTYIYNVSQFDSKFTWLDLNWVPRGDAITNTSGQIVVNFTGFYDDDPLAFGASCFNNPIPYINISFIENITGMLVTNTTFYNVSNSEAGLSLAIGYNSFHSGFLIQINNLGNLTTLAAEQVLDSGFLPGEFIFKEYDYMIEFTFKQDNKNQNSTMIYDRTTGILVYSKVQSIFGPDFEIQLSDYELNFQKTEPPDETIPSFPFLLLGITITGALILIMWIVSKKLKSTQ